ncbi:unnamed protein product [Polarella glacialis]|uniref:Uncharacterized protein n=1 Tax=Polarella glacialis TaxID=89957 RepID=A0A813JFB8_POLGL|nr:unnamed protein product [Polarella glacialis]
MIRNSEVGHLFLDLILERRWWSGLGMADQDAVGETLLELISLENVEVGGRKYDYRCMNAMFFKPASMQDPERPWAYMSTNYGMCWHRAAQYLAGPIGQRRSCIVGLVSPLLANLNAQPYSDLIWKVPPGGWNMQRSGKLRANFGAGLGAARPSDRWNRGADSMLVVHFAGLGPTKLELMAWGLRAPNLAHRLGCCCCLLLLLLLLLLLFYWYCCYCYCWWLLLLFCCWMFQNMKTCQHIIKTPCFQNIKHDYLCTKAHYGVRPN